MAPFLEQITLFIRRLTLGQKLAISGVLVGSAALLISLAYWVSQPDYSLLFGSLDTGDANRVIEALQADKIPYELEENGAAILVPRDMVSDLRVRFAGEGLVSDGPSGYELFDQGTLGMTDFMQKFNFKRALEGELTRTLTNLKPVETARVHLVLPERSAFRRTQTPPSASVVLQFAGGNRLNANQIDGITALVGGAVEGLSSSDVTVIDTRGNILSNPEAGDENALLTSTQLGTQRSIEQHLVGQGQSMLDQVLGPGNAIVRVAATIDFTRSVAERKIIDPESATVISEEKLEEQNDTQAANSQVRNYEISETRERSEKNEVEIDYLTVSVILNQKLDPPDAATPEAPPEPRLFSEDEIVEIEGLVQNAVGFNPERGDRFAIHQTRFDTSADDLLAQEMQDHQKLEQLQLYIRYGLMALAVLLALWLMRSASRRAGALTEPTLTAEEAAAQLTGGNIDALADGALGSDRQLGQGDDDDYVLVDDVYTSKLSPEARARLKAKHMMFDEITASVLANPDEAADVLRSWIVEDLTEAQTH